MKATLALALLTLAPAAFAQEPTKGPKVTTLNFDDDSIDGALQRPDGEHVQARVKVKHANLIRVRSEFNRRAMQAMGELK
ncbi:MAG: hypothetical protein IPJ65_37885 [Archangiaceae bacterium]|nr:hypothetical protein [Archangiaceae bacterium]